MWHLLLLERGKCCLRCKGVEVLTNMAKLEEITISLILVILALRTWNKWSRFITFVGQKIVLKFILPQRAGIKHEMTTSTFPWQIDSNCKCDLMHWRLPWGKKVVPISSISSTHSKTTLQNQLKENRMPQRSLRFDWIVVWCHVSPVAGIGQQMGESLRQTPAQTHSAGPDVAMLSTKQARWAFIEQDAELPLSYCRTVSIDQNLNADSAGVFTLVSLSS